ncbi:MAG: hypothetical protein Q7T80_17280 [Methanoregula sp.]|nr:hypothetical protein [Methanoregula sp.]
MTFDKKSLALVTLSTAFFSVFGMFLLVFVGGISGSRLEIPWFGSNYLAALQGVLGLISAGGCIFYLSLTKHQSRRWYFGIPLAIALTGITLSSFISPLSLIPDIVFLNQNTGQAALFLLAPCSALFFYSEKQTNDSDMGLVIISLIICILSALLLYGLIFPPQYAPGSKTGAGPTLSELCFWIYYMLGLPIIGALFLSRASGFHHQESEPGNHSDQKPAETP